MLCYVVLLVLLVICVCNVHVYESFCSLFVIHIIYIQLNPQLLYTCLSHAQEFICQHLRVLQRYTWELVIFPKEVYTRTGYSAG